MNRIGNGLVMSLIGLGVATTAARWLITPINHLDASDARVAAVMIQFVVGMAVLAWGWRRHGEDRRARGPRYGVLTSGVVLLIMGAVLAASAIQWLMTPTLYPHASAIGTGMVWGQALVGAGLMAASRPRLRNDPAI